jgi:FAD/FMN-containing dehydrogenase
MTADGGLLIADDQQNADVLWAMRGAGPGFFGVVTQYRLKLYESPRAITTSTYAFSLDDIEEVGAWAGSLAGRLPSDVELALFIAPAPPDLVEPCRSANGFVGILSATAFLNTQRESFAALTFLQENFPLQPCLRREVNRADSFDSLLTLGGMLWPERHRALADTLWSNAPPPQPLAILRDYFLRAPSPKSLALCAFSTGAADKAPLPDAAFSMTARSLLLCYAIWEQPGDDAANASWHREMMAALDPFAAGHYVGESDIVSQPARAERSFARANWQRLRSLRRTYDPDERFLGHFRV